MKKILLCLLLLCSIAASAQDVIVKRDGTAIVCRIVNVSSLEIVYKAWTDLQGPNLVMNVADASYLTYENGEKKVFENASSTQPSPIVQGNTGQQTVSDAMLMKLAEKTKTKNKTKTKTKTQPELTPLEPQEIAKMRKRAKRLKTAGWVTGSAMVAGGAFMILASQTFASDSFYTDWMGTYWGGSKVFRSNDALLYAGIGMAGGGLITSSACLIRAHNLKKKASQYSVQSAPLYQQEFHLKNGTTLSPSVNILKDNTRHIPTLGLGLAYNF